MNEPFNRVVGSFWRATADAPGRALPVSLVLRLQRAVGNREVTRLLLARQSAAREKPEERVTALLPEWVYVVSAAATGILIGTIIAKTAGVSHERLFEIPAALGVLGSGAAYLGNRLRARLARARKS